MSKARMHYKLFAINTDMKIKDILSFLSARTKNHKEIGPIRKDFTRNIKTGEYSEKTRKLALLDVEFYRRLRNSGYGEDGDKAETLEILPYTITNEDYAHKKSSVMHYYFPLETDRDNVECISYKLNRLTEMEMIGAEDWYVHPCGIVEFSPNVPATLRVMMKIIIDNPADFRVSWVRLNVWGRIEKHFEGNE